MMSGAETILESHEEVEEFCSLAGALGMDVELADTGGGGESEADLSSQQDSQHQQQEEDHHLKQQQELEEEETVDLAESEEELDLNKDVSEEGGKKKDERQAPQWTNQVSSKDKDKRFEKLKALIEERRIGGDNVKGKVFFCPIQGCGTMRKERSGIIHHLSTTHFNSKLGKKRRAEESMSAKENTCAICKYTSANKTNLFAHYGVVHNDLADVALDRVAADVKWWKKQQSCLKNRRGRKT